MPIKTFLTPAEIQAMIAWPDNLRDRLILSFYGDTGCRASELLKLKVENLDLENGLVMIPHLKRGIKKKCPSCSRMAGKNTPFCSRCGMDLREVQAEGIEERNRLISIGESTAELFREYTKEMDQDDQIITITRQQIYNLVRAAAAGIGIKGKALTNPETGKKHFPHPHNFRDSLAVSWLAFAGADSGKQKALQEHLGHKNFETTMGYNKLTPGKVQEVSDEVRQMRFPKAKEEPQLGDEKSENRSRD